MQRDCKKELKKLVAELASREAQLEQARAAAQTSQAEEDSLASEIADIEHRLQVFPYFARLEVRMGGGGNKGKEKKKKKKRKVMAEAG